jgi:hypothetical protein
MSQGSKVVDTTTPFGERWGGCGDVAFDRDVEPHRPAPDGHFAFARQTRRQCPADAAGADNQKLCGSVFVHPLGTSGQAWVR